MHPEDLPDFLRREGLRALETATGEDLLSRYGTDAGVAIPGVCVARVGFDPAGESTE